MRLPPKAAGSDEVHRIASGLSEIRESIGISSDGVNCPVCHVASIDLESYGVLAPVRMTPAEVRLGLSREPVGQFALWPRIEVRLSPSRCRRICCSIWCILAAVVAGSMVDHGVSSLWLIFPGLMLVVGLGVIRNVRLAHVLGLLLGGYALVAGAIDIVLAIVFFREWQAVFVAAAYVLFGYTMVRLHCRAGDRKAGRIEAAQRVAPTPPA